MVGVGASDIVDDNLFGSFVGSGDDVAIAVFGVNVEMRLSEVSHLYGTGFARPAESFEQYLVDERVLFGHVGVRII